MGCEYDYEKEKAWLFTDEGQRALFDVRDKVLKLVEAAGAVMAGRIISAASPLCSDSFRCLTVVDRLVELGELDWVEETKARVYQHQLLVRGLQKGGRR